MKFITVSYFTDSDGSDYYRKSAERLAIELNRFGLEQDIQEIAYRGSYRENCIFKPVFILKELLASKYPLLWLDADSKLLRFPRNFVDLSDGTDIALSTPTGNLRWAKASPLFFNYHPKSLEFLCAWIDRIEFHQQQKIVSFDHEPLLEVLGEFAHTLQIQDVGPEYCVLESQCNSMSVISMGISSSESKNQALREMQIQERGILPGRRMVTQ
ncbi:MAG: hypothetical protein ACXWT1_04565 [Methylobacter sp.]